MKPHRLAALGTNGIGFDLETDLIQPGLVTPPIVLGSAAELTPAGIKGVLLDKQQALDLFMEIVNSASAVLIGANIAFDVLCVVVEFARRGVDIMPEVLAMYDRERGAIRGDVDGRVLDVQHTEALHAIAHGMLGLDPRTGRKMPGRYSLDEVTWQVLGRKNAKANDKFRLSYFYFHGVPLDQLPPEARTYPIDDAVNTVENGLAQAGIIDNVGPHDWRSRDGITSCIRCSAHPGGEADCSARYPRQNMHEISRQCYTALCMSLGAAWGFTVDQAAVDALEAKHHAEHDGKEAPFVAAGVLRADGTECQAILKRRVAIAYGAKATCATCMGTGKVPSPATEGRTKINCSDCDGTALLLPPEVPRSEKGGIGKGRDVLRESGDEFLTAYAEHTEGRKITETYIPFLRGMDKEGVPHPGVPLVLRPNPILETGRTSYDGVIQLMPREGGIRECIVARPGRVFSSEDYTAGELVTHAQSCMWIVGASRLADVLNTGIDAHLAGAATVLGISYDDAVARMKAGDKQVKDARQAFKPANFGFPGRMGAAKLTLQQRKGGPDTPHASGTLTLANGKLGYKGLRFCLLMGAADVCGDVKVMEWNGRPLPPTCKKCIECATQLRASWLKQWPENTPYFDFVKAIDESGKPVVQHMSKRLRGFRQGLTDDDGKPMNSGNAIANGYFQALLADAAKNALMAATRECYDPTTIVQSCEFGQGKFAGERTVSMFEGQRSPLLGSRIIVFQHDELVCEHPEEIAHEAATRISEIMVEALRIACPDLRAACKAEPTLMRRLYKGAEKTVGADGRLIPWQPKAKA